MVQDILFAGKNKPNVLLSLHTAHIPVNYHV
jgi:hypothetical protein